MKMKKFLLGAVIATLSVSCMPTYHLKAESIESLEAKKKLIENEKTLSEKALKESEDKRVILEEEIKILDMQNASAEKDLEITSKLLIDSTAALSVSEENLKKASETKDNQMDTFATRMRAIYENGDLGYIKVIMEAQNISDLFIRIQYVNDILNSTKKTLDEFIEIENTIKESTAIIAEEKKNIEILAVQQTEKAQHFESLLSEKMNASLKIQQDEDLYEKEIASFEAASLEVEKLIKAEEEKAAAEAAAAAAKQASAASSTSAYVPSSSSTGAFSWPVPGYTRVSSGYGNRAKPIGSGYEFHTGIDIPAGYGVPVIAAADGKIITSKYMNGYGNTVIIDHGNGVTTLYGHNSSLSCSVGDIVKKGQTIAKVGSTGNSTGNHVHFEVRKNGSHTNPYDYL